MRRLTAIVVLLALCSCRILITPIEQDAGDDAPCDVASETTETEPELEPMTNGIYTQARADIISGALDITSGLEVQLVASLDPNLSTFAEFDAADTHINEVVEDAGYLVSGRQPLTSIVYSDPGLGAADMTGEAGWSAVTYFPFRAKLEWINALVIRKGTVPIVWIDVTGSQCGKAPLPIQDIAGNFIEVYWHALGIFDEDTNEVFAPALCTNEPLRPNALDVDLTAPGAAFPLVGSP